MMIDKLGIILPSRGLVFSKTMESVFNNIKNKDCNLYITHDLPLPDCFNIPLEKALKDKCNLIWFVEEDMLIPEGTLDKMIKMILRGSTVVSADYANKNNGESFTFKNKNEVLFTGMGCMLLDSSVFKKIKKPYIRQGTFWIKEDEGNKYLEYHPEIPQKGYGTQDVYLCQELIRTGNKIDLVDAKIGHLKLIEKSDPLSNNGKHTIKEVYIT